MTSSKYKCQWHDVLRHYRVIDRHYFRGAFASWSDRKPKRAACRRSAVLHGAVCSESTASLPTANDFREAARQNYTQTRSTMIDVAGNELRIFKRRCSMTWNCSTVWNEYDEERLTWKAETNTTPESFGAWPKGGANAFQQTQMGAQSAYWAKCYLSITTDNYRYVIY